MSRYQSALSPNIPWWGYPVVLSAFIGWTFLVPGYWIFLGSVACVTAIVALGLTVLVGWAGQVSLAQAALTGTAVYITSYLIREDTVGLPFLLAAGAGVLISAILGGLPAIATAKLPGIYVMVLTLGLQVTIERTIFTDGRLTGGEVGAQIFKERPKFLVSFEPERMFYMLAFGTMVAVIILLTLFRKSRHGRALLLVRTNREAACAVGISPIWYKVLAFVIAGALAGLGGALTAPLYRSPPTAFDYFTIPSLFLLAIPVVAGFESLLAVVVVSFTFTLLPHALQSYDISPFVLGGFGLVVGTYIGPQGLGGAVLDFLRARTGSTRNASPAPLSRDGTLRPSNGMLATDEATRALRQSDDGLARTHLLTTGDGPHRQREARS